LEKFNSMSKESSKTQWFLTILSFDFLISFCVSNKAPFYQTALWLNTCKKVNVLNQNFLNKDFWKHFFNSDFSCSNKKKNLPNQINKKKCYPFFFKCKFPVQTQSSSFSKPMPRQLTKCSRNISSVIFPS